MAEYQLQRQQSDDCLANTVDGRSRNPCKEHPVPGESVKRMKVISDRHKRRDVKMG